MRYFARFSPFAAYRDLRLFLSHRQKHELWFGLLAIVLTTTLIAGFVVDSRVERPPEPRSILYVESWPLSRTDRQIIEQQKRDLVIRERRDAEIRKARLERQRQFQRLDDRLESFGF